MGATAALITRGYHLLALPSAAGRMRVLLGWLLDLVIPRSSFGSGGRRALDG